MVSVLRRWSLINRSTILAFFTFKSIAKHAGTTGNRGHPRPIHPRWVMPNMLVVPAFELCDPLSLMVLVIAGNTTQAWSAVFYRWIGRFHNTSQSVTLGRLASNTSPPLSASVYPKWQDQSNWQEPTPKVLLQSNLWKRQSLAMVRHLALG